MIFIYYFGTKHETVTKRIITWLSTQINDDTILAIALQTYYTSSSSSI